MQKCENVRTCRSTYVISAARPAPRANMLHAMYRYIHVHVCTCSQSDIVSIKSEPSLPVDEKPPIPEQEDEGYGIPTHEA